MKKNRSKVVRLALTASLLTSLGIGLYNVSLGNGTVAKAEQIISDNPVADETSTRSITIWKYEVKDVSEIGNPGDGKESDVDKNPLSGVKFEIKKVKALEGKSLTNPLKQSEGTDYTVLETVGTITTATNGNAKIDLGKGIAADGIYLVTELADDRIAKPADPFFVYVPQTDRNDHSSLIYDVQVQPKNILNALLEPEKTVEGSEGYSIKAGNSFNWEAQANIPEGLYQVASRDMVISPVYNKDGEVIADIPVAKDTEIYADYFTMSDTLVKELLIDGVKVQAKTDDGEWTDLVFNTDYEITVDGVKQTTAPITSSANAEKKVEMSLTQAGMKKVNTSDYTKIRTVYTTHTKEDYNGVITNHFSVSYLTPGMKPIEKENSKDPELYTGGFDIEKTAEDKDAPNNKLAGAEFMLAESKDNAEKEIFIASNGKSYTKNETLPDGVTFLKSTSNEQGFAEFNGLLLNWYDDKNENGKQDIDEPTFSDHAQIQKNYWVVETKAPLGYELLKAPQEVTVTLQTEDNAKIELNVVDKPKTDLPFTGGEGTMLLVVIAIGAITLGTVTIAIEKKRRQA